MPITNKVYQLLAHGWWFSPGTLASRSSTTKTGHHDIVEILLKVVLKYKKIKYIILYAVLYTEECLLPSNLIYIYVYIFFFFINYLFFYDTPVHITEVVYTMKKNFKQWWSTIPPISSKQTIIHQQGWSTIPPISSKQTITSHLNLLNIKKTMTYDIGNPGLGQTQQCGGGVKLVNGI